jgi:hypothetical protein
VGDAVRVEEGGAVVALLSHGVFAEIDLLQFLESGELLEGVQGFDVIADADDLGERVDGGESGETAVTESTWGWRYLLLEISMAVSFQLGRLSRLSSWQSASIRMATFLYFSSAFFVSSSNLPILILLRSSSVELSSISPSFYLIYFRALIWC